MRVILCLCTFLMSMGMLTAQNSPVKWTFEAQKVGDREYEIVATADIQSGWSVYSQDMKSADGPMPTKIMIDKANNLKVVGGVKEVGAKKTEYDELFEMDIVKLSGKTYFRQRVKIKGDIDEVKGQISFMTCCASSCMPPANVAFSIPLD